MCEFKMPIGFRNVLDANSAIIDKIGYFYIHNFHNQNMNA